MAQRTFCCSDCGHHWGVAFGTGRPACCPQCKSANLHRAEGERDFACGGGKGRGSCGQGRGRESGVQTQTKE